MRMKRYRKTRYWAVVDAADTLVCLCVYRKGAEEVIKRLQDLDNAQQWVDINGPAEDVAGDVVDCPMISPVTLGQRQCGATSNNS
jgi:hypothetical protein